MLMHAQLGAMAVCLTLLCTLLWHVSGTQSTRSPHVMATSHDSRGLLITCVMTARVSQQMPCRRCTWGSSLGAHRMKIIQGELLSRGRKSTSSRAAFCLFAALHMTPITMSQ